MSNFNNGGGDLTATNLVAALLELAVKLTRAEDDYNATSPQFPLNTTTFQVASGNQSVTVSSTLPLSDSRTTGIYGLQARNIFAGTTYGDFNPGTDGDLVATDLAAAFFDLCCLVDIEEKKVRANIIVPQPKIVVHTVDLNTRIGTITLSIPVTVGLAGSNGDVIMSAVDVLPTPNP